MPTLFSGTICGDKSAFVGDDADVKKNNTMKTNQTENEFDRERDAFYAALEAQLERDGYDWRDDAKLGSQLERDIAAAETDGRTKTGTDTIL